MGGRGGSSGLHSATPEQKKKMANIERTIAKNKFASDLKFSKNKDGSIGFEYKEERIIHKEKGGKMQSPDKADIYLRTTIKSGRILKDGLIKHNKDEKEEKLVRRGRR